MPENQCDFIFRLRSHRSRGLVLTGFSQALPATRRQSAPAAFDEILKNYRSITREEAVLESI